MVLLCVMRQDFNILIQVKEEDEAAAVEADWKESISKHFCKIKTHCTSECFRPFRVLFNEIVHKKSEEFQVKSVEILLLVRCHGDRPSLPDSLYIVHNNSQSDSSLDGTPCHCQLKGLLSLSLNCSLTHVLYFFNKTFKI